MENPSRQLHQVVGPWDDSPRCLDDLMTGTTRGANDNKTMWKAMKTRGFSKHVLEMVGFSTSFRMLQEGSHL